jgi:stearoyl-CoA desaturase (Delta-9 desaturase)
MTAPTSTDVPAITDSEVLAAGAPSAPWNQPQIDDDLDEFADNQQSLTQRIILGLLIGVPFLAIVVAIPVAWGGWLSWTDVGIGVAMYLIAGHGVTAGFHRHFTHLSYKAKRPLRIALAIAGSLGIEGPVIRWVADHRRHHKYSDKEGDPHSPWRYGDTIPALMKGLLYAHMGWLFDVEQTDQRQYAPDLIKDPDIRRISRAFPVFVLASLAVPPIVGGLLTWSWQGALTAFFWASLVRIGLMHHVTWSINSICHAVGARTFRSRDKSGNVWWLAALSMGESWHNLHHADPTCARHGVLKGQIDSTARLIWIFEKLGWAYAVRWPQASRIEARRLPDAASS